jgi:hypothetical protein
LTKNAAIPKKEVISRLTKLERAPEIVWDVEKAYLNTIKKFNTYLQEADWTAHWVLQARKRFYSDKYVKKILEWPDKPLRDAIVDIWQEVNGIVAKYVDDTAVKASLRKQNMLFEIRKVLAKKWDMVWTTSFERFIKKNKSKFGRLAGAAWFGALWGWVNSLIQ